MMFLLLVTSTFPDEYSLTSVADLGFVGEGYQIYKCTKKCLRMTMPTAGQFPDKKKGSMTPQKLPLDPLVYVPMRSSNHINGYC